MNSWNLASPCRPQKGIPLGLFTFEWRGELTRFTRTTLRMAIEVVWVHARCKERFSINHTMTTSCQSLKRKLEVNCSHRQSSKIFAFVRCCAPWCPPGCWPAPGVVAYSWCATLLRSDWFLISVFASSRHLGVQCLKLSLEHRLLARPRLVFVSYETTSSTPCPKKYMAMRWMWR